MRFKIIESKEDIKNQEVDEEILNEEEDDEMLIWNNNIDRINRKLAQQ